VRMQKQPRIEYSERRVYERFESLATRRPETDHAHIGEAGRLGIAAPSDNDDFEALIEARQRRIQMFAVRFDGAHDIGYATQANGADFQGQPRSRTGTLSCARSWAAAVNVGNADCRPRQSHPLRQTGEGRVAVRLYRMASEHEQSSPRARAPCLAIR